MWTPGHYKKSISGYHSGIISPYLIKFESDFIRAVTTSHLKAATPSGMRLQGSGTSLEVLPYTFFREGDHNRLVCLFFYFWPSGGRYNNLKTYGLSNELFEISVQPGDSSKSLDISDIRIVNRSDAKGCTYNLGEFSLVGLIWDLTKKYFEFKLNLNNIYQGGMQLQVSHTSEIQRKAKSC